MKNRIEDNNLNHLNISQSSIAITEAKLQQLEKKYKFIFPQEYKDFLLQHNGGVPSRIFFTTKNGKIFSIIKRFFPVDIKDEFSLQSEIEEITLAGFLPQELIPIAIMPDETTRLLLGISGTNYGKVYHWSWGAEEEDCEPSYEFIEPVADSFNEFLDLLTETRDI